MTIPKIILYQAKTESECFSRNLRKYFIIKYPTINAVRKPTRNKYCSVFSRVKILMSNIFFMPAPSTIGILNKKENLAASERFNFKTIPVIIVLPDRETPGIKANAWAQPMMIASGIDNPSKEAVFLDHFSTMKIIIAPTINEIETTNRLLKYSSM